MYCVQISARIIRWPSVCACCTQRADANVEISSTRITGKKVIHTQTKAWAIPYCRRCLVHIQAAKDLKSFSMVVGHLSVALGFLGVLLAVILWVAGAILAILALAITAGLVLATFRRCHEKYQRDCRAKQAQRADLERRLQSLLSHSCCEREKLAASYEGWHGSVHTFLFSSSQFAGAFEQANPGKCLRGGQIHR
jgi:hypothetical protein